MQLIYRAQMFRYVTRASILLHPPRTMNWRYQVADSTDHPSVHFGRNLREARTFNWRFQMVLGS